MDGEKAFNTIMTTLLIFCIVLGFTKCGIRNWHEYQDRKICVASGYADTIDWQAVTFCIGYTDDGTIRIAPLAEFASGAAPGEAVR